MLPPLTLSDLIVFLGTNLIIALLTSRFLPFPFEENRIFWKEKRLRITVMIISVCFVVAVAAHFLEVWQNLS